MRTLLSAAIITCLTGGSTAVLAGEGSETASNDKQAMQAKQPFGVDNTSDVRHEPCPDYFDTDWAETNPKTAKCINDQGDLVSVATLKESQTADTTAMESSTSSETGDQPRSDMRSGQGMASDTSSERQKDRMCQEKDMSDQAVAQSAYERELERHDPSQRASISVDFTPEMETAKSVNHLEDRDITSAHLDATFAALDNDDSSGVDKVEALDLRGLADDFEQVDYNGDGVISEAEFDLRYEGRLANTQALCLDGERVTQLSQIDS